MQHPARTIPKGQSMLELVVAIGIIVACVVTILGLVLSTTTSSNASKAEILATNLAREGVEVARGQRDSNWLAMDAGVANSSWNKNLYYEDSPGHYDYTAIAQFQPPPSSAGWTLLFSENALGAARTEMYLHPTKGIYTQLENLGDLNCSGGLFCNFQAIQYWRLLQLNPICWHTGGPTLTFPEHVLGDTANGPGDPCAIEYGADYSQVGIRVRSRVRWLEHGSPHNVEVDDKLFNWKP